LQRLLDDRPEYVRLRFAFVAYRDFCDGSNQLEVFPFTSDRIAVIDFIAKQRATGGGDGPEDLLGRRLLQVPARRTDNAYDTGGLDAALKLNWASVNRFVVLVADAPCHGIEFSGPGSGDSYPEGNPDGLEAETVLAALRELEVQFLFTKLTGFTDLMISRFNSIIPIQEVIAVAG
jgi:hypothetical protein